MMEDCSDLSNCKIDSWMMEVLSSFNPLLPNKQEVYEQDKCMYMVQRA